MRNPKQLLPAILLISFFLMGGIFAYRYSLSNLANNQLEQSLVKNNPSSLVASSRPSSIASAISKKPRNLSEREKYEIFLNNHPFNNRLHETNEGARAVRAGEDRDARKEMEEQDNNKPDRPDLAFEQDFLRTMNPSLKRPTPEVLPNIIKKNHQGRGSNAKITGLPGDNTSTATNWKELGPNNVGGRTRALTWDPTTSNKVWAGGTSGGLWYNNNIADANSSWVKVDDFWSTLSITKIVFDPTNLNLAYASTGEGFGTQTTIGAGIWKTENGGITWNQLSATANMRYMNDLIVRKETIAGNLRGVLYAAIDQGYSNYKLFNEFGFGLYRSEDFGNSWTQVMPLTGNNTAYVPSSIQLSASNRIWVGTKSNSIDDGNGDNGGGSVLYSDNGTTWNVSNTLANATNGRVTVACAPSDANYIYSLIENATANGTGNPPIVMRKSTNNGASWTNMSIPIDEDEDIPADDFTRGQAWYDQALAVDPNNPRNLIVGGIDLFRSTDEGTTWSQISKWSNNNNLNNLPCSYVHADQHTITFKPGVSSTMLFGNDGGVYYTSNITAAGSSQAIVDRNKNYNVTQFYSASIYPIAGKNYHLAGAQDNGTQQFQSDNFSNTREVFGGDGGYCFIDQTNPGYQIVSYVNNNFSLYYPTGNGDTSSIDLILSDNTGSFINPACYDNNLHALYTYKSSDPNSGGSLYRVKNITSAPAFKLDSIDISNLTSPATAFKVSPYATTSTTLFIGTASGRLIKITNANGASPTETDITGSLPTGSISCIEIGSNDNELLVTFFNYGINKIFYSANGGASWNSKMGDFPNIPVRWAMFNPKNIGKEVILATELGIYGTTNFINNAPTWAAKNTGFSNVRTDMLQLRASDKMVIAATYGRGLFSSMGFSESVPSISSFTPTAAASGATVTITGTNLSGATAVSFGGTAAASFIVLNSTTITAVVGTGSSGSIVVTTPSGVATKTGFTLISTTTPTITSFTPTDARKGETVTITGTNLTGTTAINFGGTAASSFTVVNSSTITAVVGAGSSGNIAVTTPVGTASITGFVFVQPLTVTVTGQPSCTEATGTITVSSPTAGLTFSIDGSNYTNTSGLFTGVAAGTYSVTSKTSSGVVSAAVSVTVTAQPAIPAAPTSSVTAQPTCTVASGTISVSSPTTGLTFSIDGSTYANTNGIFTALAAGTYSVIAKNSVGCISKATVVTILAQPTKPEAPIITAGSSTSFCDGGSVVLSSSASSGNQWYKDNLPIAGANASTFSALASGIYTDTIVNPNGGCKAGSLPITVTIIAAPAKPVITWNGSNLSTSASASTYQWTLNDVALFGASLATYKPIAIGLYKIKVTNSVGCNNTSEAFNLVVTALNNPATSSISNLASVFPNPASPVLLVKFREAPNTTLDIRLVTNDGRTVQLVRTKDKLTTIPINHLPSGKYYIRITGKQYNQTEAVIISK